VQEIADNFCCLAVTVWAYYRQTTDGLTEYLAITTVICKLVLKITKIYEKLHAGYYSED